jgi:L-alanine-DL-glutamate epimerase-like enolase superfamily enzyme
MKITDLKCAVIGQNPIVRITTDAGISGYGEVENTKPYLKPHILFYKQYLIGEDPTNVERVMMKIRRMGSFKPWGSSVSAIDIALWDIAGKAAGLPVYKLWVARCATACRYNGGAHPMATPQVTPRTWPNESLQGLQHHQAGHRLPQRHGGRCQTLRRPGGGPPTPTAACSPSAVSSTSSPVSKR